MTDPRVWDELTEVDGWVVGRLGMLKEFRQEDASWVLSIEFWWWEWAGPLSASQGT